MCHQAGHVPVMLDSVIECLSPHPGQTVVDGTAGGGGHAEAFRRRILPDGQLILIDRDRGALERLKARFGRRGNVRYFHANFCDIDEVLRQAGCPAIDACLLDLGLSSLQLADAERGDDQLPATFAFSDQPQNLKLLESFTEPKCLK